MVNRALFAGEGVAIRADAREVAVHLNRVAIRGPLEDHMFEEVRYPRDFRGLIVRSGLDPERQGDAQCGRVRFAYDFQAIGQLLLME